MEICVSQRSFISVFIPEQGKNISTYVRTKGDTRVDITCHNISFSVLFSRQVGYMLVQYWSKHYNGNISLLSYVVKMIQK